MSVSSNSSPASTAFIARCPATRARSKRLSVTRRCVRAPPIAFASLQTQTECNRRQPAHVIALGHEHGDADGRTSHFPRWMDSVNEDLLGELTVEYRSHTWWFVNVDGGPQRCT
jgi:hypothetical protein